MLTAVDKGFTTNTHISRYSGCTALGHLKLTKSHPVEFIKHMELAMVIIR